MTTKHYRQVPLHEGGEELVPIPRGPFAFFDPHPYVAAGAGPLYGQTSPYMLRRSVLQAVEKAQKDLEARKKGWKIMFFDAFRPNDVQLYMVEQEFRKLAAADGLDPNALTPEQREAIAPRVWRLWAYPSEDPATPPPHSTGAAMDVTLADETGCPVFMGSELDENSDRSYPDYFDKADNEAGKLASANRALLNDIMTNAGFMRWHNEWWHFSLGDQMWCWGRMQQNPELTLTARYGGWLIRPDGLPALRG